MIINEERERRPNTILCQHIVYINICQLMRATSLLKFVHIINTDRFITRHHHSLFSDIANLISLDSITLHQP